jgi:hypothetical protein
MAKVYGIHEVELCPGVTEQEFEKYVNEEVMRLSMYPGWKATLVKADRGAREGKYAFLFEIDSVEARDRFSPTPNGRSDEARAFDAEHAATEQPIVDKWSRYMTTMVGVNTVFSDYVEVVGA